MRVQCKECQTEFKIPKEKVPEGMRLKIHCPKCKTANEICREATPAEPDRHGQNQSEALKAAFDPVSDYGSEIDVVDEGIRTAMLCATNVKRAERITQALHELDFWVIHALRPGFALGKLHHNHYDLIVLEDNYNSEQDSNNLVLHHIQLLPMHQRRQFYLCLLSQEKPTLDSKLAFRMGVNLILNVRDLEKAKVMLAREMKEYRSFYSLFNAELAKK
ncbi:MAG: zinc-ribbon domain-containing protein [Syntrophobacteraceae bacterium]